MFPIDADDNPKVLDAALKVMNGDVGLFVLDFDVPGTTWADAKLIFMGAKRRVFTKFQVLEMLATIAAVCKLGGSGEVQAHWNDGDKWHEVWMGDFGPDYIEPWIAQLGRSEISWWTHGGAK